MGDANDGNPALRSEALDREVRYSMANRLYVEVSSHDVKLRRDLP